MEKPLKHQIRLGLVSWLLVVSSNYFVKFHDFSMIIQGFFKFHDFSMHGTFFGNFPGFSIICSACGNLKYGHPIKEIKATANAYNFYILTDFNKICTKQFWLINFVL